MMHIFETFHVYTFLQVTPYDYEKIAFVLQSLKEVEQAAQLKPEQASANPVFGFYFLVGQFISYGVK